MRVQERRGSVKTPFFILKNIKFLILWIDNIDRLVYYLIKIKEIRRNQNGRTQGYQIYRNKDFQEG